MFSLRVLSHFFYFPCFVFLTAVVAVVYSISSCFYVYVAHFLCFRNWSQWDDVAKHARSQNNHCRLRFNTNCDSMFVTRFKDPMPTSPWRGRAISKTLLSKHNAFYFWIKFVVRLWRGHVGTFFYGLSYVKQTVHTLRQSICVAHVAYCYHRLQWTNSCLRSTWRKHKHFLIVFLFFILFFDHLDYGLFHRANGS